MRRAITFVGIGALVVAGCSGVQVSGTTVATTDVPPTTASSSTSTLDVTTTSATSLGPSVIYDPDVPRYGGEVIIAAEREPTTLNPYAPGGDDSIVALVGQAHLARVYDVDPDTLELVPDVVTEIPRIDNGGVVLNGDGTMDVTWHIRPEAQWSDGFPITGDDLAFTLEFRLATIECTGRQFDPQPPPPVEVTAIEPKNITVHFPAPSLQHETLFEWVVPSHSVADTNYCDDWNSTIWPAGGPFEVAEWVGDGPEHQIRLVRNENYWKVDGEGRALPYLDEVRFVFIPETEDLLAAFSDRHIDVMNPPPSPAEIPLERLAASGADVQLIPGPVWEHLNFQFGPDNRNTESLNGILEFRLAIAYGLDRRALLDDAGFGWLEVAQGFLGSFTVAATSEPWRRYEHDEAEARRLLAIACEKADRDCIADPPRVVYSTTSNADFRPAIADVIARQLSAIGISVELQLEDSQLFYGATLDGGTWDVGNWAWSGQPGSEALVRFFDLFSSDRPERDDDNYYNVYNWGTAESSVAGDDAVAQLQQLVDRMRSSFDAAEIVALARQAEQLVADQVVIIPLNTRAVLGVVWADEIQGFRMNPSPSGPTWNIEHWYRVGE